MRQKKRALSVVLIAVALVGSFSYHRQYDSVHSPILRVASVADSSLVENIIVQSPTQQQNPKPIQHSAVVDFSQPTKAAAKRPAPVGETRQKRRKSSRLTESLSRKTMLTIYKGYVPFDPTWEFDFGYVLSTISHLPQDDLPFVSMPHYCWDARGKFHHMDQIVEIGNSRYVCKFIGHNGETPMHFWEPVS